GTRAAPPARGGGLERPARPGPENPEPGPTGRSCTTGDDSVRRHELRDLGLEVLPGEAQLLLRDLDRFEETAGLDQLPETFFGLVVVVAPVPVPVLGHGPVRLRLGLLLGTLHEFGGLSPR